MAFELLLLCALIFIFIVSFCGLLQKIKQSYDRERLIADRLARRQAGDRNSGESFSEVYMNSAYQTDARSNDLGIFPAAPPPYTQTCVDPPPKYEDVIKIEDVNVTAHPATEIRRTETATTTDVPRVHSAPPLYTIST